MSGARELKGPRPERRRWRAWAVAALASSLVLGGVGMWAAGRASGWIRGSLESRLEAALGGRSSVERLEWALWPPRLRVEGLQLHNEEGLHLQVARAEAVAGWSGLWRGWRGAAALERLGIEGLDLRVERGYLERAARRAAPAGRRRWRIGRLEVHDASVHYGDRTWRLEFDAEDLSVEGRWSTLHDALRGRVEATGFAGLPWGARGAFEAGGGFSVGPAGLAIDSLHVRGEGLEAHLSRAAWPGTGGKGWEFQGQARLTLEAAAWKPAALAAWRGTVETAWTLRAGSDAWRLNGTLAARRVEHEGFDASDLAGEFDAGPEGFELRLSGASFAGGTLEGTVRAARVGSQAWRVRGSVAGRGLSLGALGAAWGRPLPVGSRLDLSLRLEGSDLDPTTWHAFGEVRADADPGGGAVPLALDGRVAWNRDRLRLEPLRLQSRGWSGELSGQAWPASGRMRLERLVLRSESLASAQASWLALADAWGIALPELARQPVAGRAELACERIWREPTALRCQAQFEELSFAGASGVSVHGAWQLDPAGWHADTLQISGQGWRARLGARGAFATELVHLEDLELDQVPLEPWVSRWLAGWRGGVLDAQGELVLDFEGRPLEGHAAFALHGGSWWGQRIESLAGRLEGHEGRWKVDPLEAKGPAGVFVGRAGASLAAREWNVEAVHFELELGALEGLEDWRLSGRVGGGGVASYAANGWRGKLDIAAEALRCRGFELGTLAGGLTFESSSVQIALTRPREGGFHLEGRLELEEGWPFVAVARFDRLVFEAPLAFARDAWARVEGRLALRGPLARPRAWSMEGRVGQAELFLGAERLVARDVTARLGAGWLEVGPATVEGTGSRAELALRWNLADDLAQGKLEGVLDAGVLALAWPELRARGSVGVRLEIEGPLEAPRFRGEARMEDGRLYLAGLREPLERLSWRLVWEGGPRARIEALSARLGGGEIQGTGAVLLEGWHPTHYRVELELTQVRLTLPEGFRGTYEGALVWEGDREGARLGGELLLVRGRYRESWDLPALGGGGGPLLVGTAPWEAGFPLELDLRVRASGNVWVRNPLVQAELAGDLRIAGSPQRPELQGVVQALEGGEILLRDVVYTVEEARFELDERLPVFNPYLHLTATTRLGDYDITLQVDGPLGRLEYALTSEPTLPPQDIVALLATGQAPEPGTAGTTRSLGGDIVAAYFAEALTEPFERQLQRLLRLERVRIDPMLLEGQPDPTTRVTLGEQVGKRIFLTYSTDLGATTERQLYRVEWQLAKRFRVLFERDTTGGVGGALRYTRRFGDPRAQQAPPVPGPPAPERPRVLEVAWSGMEELAHGFGIAAGDPFERSKFVEALGRLRRLLVNRGHLAAQIDAHVEARPEGVRLRVHIDPGRPVHFRIAGLPERERKRLKERLEELWSELFLGEEIYEETLRETQQALHEEGYYAADVFLVREPGPLNDEVTLVVDRGPLVRVADVGVEGARAVPEESWRKVLRTRAGLMRRRLVPGVLEEDRAALVALYQRLGYLAARVEAPRVQLTPDGEVARVAFRVEEGAPFRIEAIEIHAPQGFDPETIRGWSGLELGSPFQAANLIAAERAVEEALGAQGYAAPVVRAQPELHEGAVRVRLEVEPGTARRVVAIGLRGNRRTKARVILSELGFEVGAPLSRQRLLEAQHRLSRLGVFRSVRVDWRPEQDDGAVVVVEVEEAAPVAMALGAGYDSEAGPRGSFSITHHNPGGRRRQLSFQTRASRLERRMQWLVRDPVLFARANWNGLLNFSWEELDEVAFDVERRAAALRLEQRTGRHWIHHYRYRFQRVDLRDVEDTIAVLEQKLENLRLGELAYALIYDTRDDPFLPQRGRLWSGELRWFAPVLGSDVPFAKLFLHGSGLRPLRRYGSLAGAVRLGLARSYRGGQAVPLSERFFAGGDATLRGFPRDGAGPRDPVTGLPTGGEALVLLNAEWRFPLWGALKGVAFYDLGNVFARVQDMELSELRHVAGAGLRFETPLGPVRIEYGRKLDREPGESRGELFVAIGTAF